MGGSKPYRRYLNLWKWRSSPKERLQEKKIGQRKW